MTTADARDDKKEYSAKITPDGVEKMRARIGIRVPHLDPRNEWASIDTIRNYTRSYGDDNPLYTDPHYAKKTRWKSVIAPPVYIRNMGMSEIKEIAPEDRDKGKGALQGIHAFWAGDTVEWLRPIYPGDRLTIEDYLYDVEEKESQFAVKSVVTRYREVYLNQRGELVCLWHRSYVRTERATAAEKKSNFSIERPKYTPEMMKEIEEAYEREELRGDSPRYWEDVKEGDMLVPVPHGPLILTDLVTFLGGNGTSLLATGKIAYKLRKKHPGNYSRNAFGVPESIVRCHYDEPYAQRIGNPFAYDLGVMRQCWMTHVITNWMGDDGWLWKLDSRIKGFNYIGDMTYVRGKVTKKYTDQGRKCVDLDVWAENQRGQITAQGPATILLPSRESGASQLPPPPSGFEGRLPKAVDW